MAVDMSMNILIVDDYKTMLRIIRNLLGSSIEVDGGSRRGATSRQRLVGLLASWA